TGHQRDTHGLSDYMRGRTCAFPLQRFMSVDPGRDGWNLYAYTRGNPLVLVDPTGRAAWRKGIQVLKVLADREKRTALVAAFRPRSRRQAVEQTKEALDQVSEAERASGVKRVVEVQSEKQRDGLAASLSSNGRARDPEVSSGYPEHVNPQEGPYSDVHVQVQGQRKSGSGLAKVGAGALVLQEIQDIVAPNLSQLVEYGDASPGALVSAAGWDITSTLDPFGVSDLIGLAAGL
ncbi:MAG: RHS repeat-associated core domain-containing protein, partial [Acidobacteriota bacterium]|nr:RHS repeat-associated core domain-containing protein [Acidobacteriota bacterium]